MAVWRGFVVFAGIVRTSVSRGPHDGYGYGMCITIRDGRKIISHGGGIDGFASYLAYYPKSDITIVILANTQGFDTRFVQVRIEEALFGAASEPQPVN